MPVATVFENLEAGSSIEEIIEQFHVTREQIQAVLEFAARSLDAPPVPVSGALPRRLRVMRSQRRENADGTEFQTANC
jgi:hypothetical protein